MKRVQLSKLALERRQKMLDMLTEVKDVTNLETASYEEVTSKLDNIGETGIMIVKKKGDWESIKLESKRTNVNGFNQSFGRYYDDPGEAYTFVKSTDVKMDVKDCLQGPSIWSPGDDVTKDDVLDFLESIIEEVRYCIRFTETILVNVHFKIRY